MPKVHILRPQDLPVWEKLNIGDFGFGRSNFFEDSKEDLSKCGLMKYDTTCLGGTFDHLHLGHKVLLSLALLNTRRKLLLGITSSVLLLKKQYHYFLEDYETRKERVIHFLKKQNPALEIETFQILDPVGVAGTDKELEACILTREVAKGGQMVNDAREKNGLPKVELVFVDMILAAEESGSIENFSNKTSSTYIR